MATIYLPTSHVEISTNPVSHSEFHRNGTSRIATEHADATPVTSVSASEASAFARALGGRLPKLNEIEEFLGAMKSRAYGFPLSAHLEWLDCSPDWATESHRMRCITAVSNASNAHVLRGSLQDQQYSFVTFRIVRIH